MRGDKEMSEILKVEVAVSSWAKWITVDKDGSAWEWEKEPVLYHAGKCWSWGSKGMGNYLYQGKRPKDFKRELYEWK
jgi:hypothetical protein